MYRGKGVDEHLLWALARRGRGPLEHWRIVVAVEHLVYFKHPSLYKAYYHMISRLLVANWCN